MKKTYIIAAILMIGGMAVLMSSSNELSTYSDFTEADRIETQVKVVGKLSKDKEIYYEPAKDPNYFSFFMKDNNGLERKVVYLAEKPQDFELSEQVVITGRMDKSDDVFLASDMLLKCPSKYKDEEVSFKKAAKS